MPQIDWPAADRLVQVIKTVRNERKREVTVTSESDHLRKHKSEVAEESTNFYATNFELGAISPLFVHSLLPAAGPQPCPQPL
ncbi:MAG: hypothetical protein ACUVXB_13785 [Bryobacteraceae bacterium]